MRLGMRFMAAAFFAIVSSGAAQATPVNLFVNGEFDAPVSVGSYTIFPTNGVPGWSTTGTGIELWQQSFLGSPTTGSDGLATGQSLEGTVSLVGSVSGTILAPAAIAMNGSLWTPNLFNVTVAAGEAITLYFQALGGNSSVSPHVDQVAFMVDVPEPGTLALLVAGLMGLLMIRRRKRSTA